MRRYNLSVDPFALPRLPLSLALLGITSDAIGTDPRTQIAWVGGAGYHAVQLNAAAPGVRPRELDRSARRDVAALLRRNGLVSSGIDLFIPPSHLTDPEHADRATAALLGGVGLAADLADLAGGAGVLSTALPHDAAASGVIHAIAEAALTRGLRIADHTWPPEPEASAESPIGVGVDPAAVFLEGRSRSDIPNDPAAAVSVLRSRLASVRLNDMAGEGRVPPGEGRLDEVAFGVAIATSTYRGHLVVDLRALRRQADVARSILDRLGRDDANAPPSA